MSGSPEITNKKESLMLRKLTGSIFLGPMRGTTGESVDTWLAQMTERQVTDLMCLAPQADVTRLSPEYEEWRENPRVMRDGVWQAVEPTGFPIPDLGSLRTPGQSEYNRVVYDRVAMGVPESKTRWRLWIFSGQCHSSTSLFLVSYGIVSNMARSCITFSAYIEAVQC